MSDLDTWWKEQAQRSPSRYHVWSIRKRTSSELLHATNDQATAEAVCRSYRPARVVGPTPKDGLYLQVNSRGSERGAWAKDHEPVAWLKYKGAAKRMVQAEDGTPIAALQISANVARNLIRELADGLLTWGKSRSEKVRKTKLRLERQGRGYVVRRGA